jgi:hypothetical protein
MMPVMAQIILWRRQGCDAKLNDIDLKDFFTLTNAKLCIHSPFQCTDNLLQHAGSAAKANHFGEVDVQSIVEEIKQVSHPRHIIRGKYIFWFFVEFSLHIHENLNLLFSRFKSPPKLKISIGRGNAMIFIAPRARCPNSLQTFIENNYRSYVNRLSPAS